MKVQFASDLELQVFTDWSYNEPVMNSQETFSQFEAEFLNAYEVVFREMSAAVRLKESGSLLEADASMSKWVDPKRVIPVVLKNAEACKPSLIQAAQRAVDQLENYAVLLLKTPTIVVIKPNGEVLASNQSDADVLRLLNLNVSE